MAGQENANSPANGRISGIITGCVLLCAGLRLLAVKVYFCCGERVREGDSAEYSRR